ncbi:hypothetical protein GCM10010402_66450 [Actinomadura luteofluorescens]|uniref:hypothetical protein n=1 Tax=Actinomadura luteofluorescens TaxID=46163 RepID=UPI00216470C2|nr:hypothetical protein [Actinomadura glauciflava]MCR3744183.1 hypothetical protein [Actinomadura glauciflava]
MPPTTKTEAEGPSTVPRRAVDLRGGMIARHPETRQRAVIRTVTRVYNVNLAPVAVLVDFGDGVAMDLSPTNSLTTYAGGGA